MENDKIKFLEFIWNCLSPTKKQKWLEWYYIMYFVSKKGRNMDVYKELAGVFNTSVENIKTIVHRITTNTNKNG